MEENLSLKNKIIFLTPIFISFILLFMLASLNAIGAGDTWWYLSCGRYMVKNVTIPKTDVFSHTFYGKPWVNSEWLTNVIFYIIFSDFGREGLAVYKISLVVLILSLVVLRTYLKTRDYYLSFLCLLFITFIGKIYLDIRAQLATFLFVTLCLLLLDLYRNGSRWVIYIIPFMVIPWVNLHGGYMYVFFILGSLWLGELFYLLLDIYNKSKVEDKKTRKLNKQKKLTQKYEASDTITERKKSLLLFFILIVVCLFLALINPYGIMAYECNFRFLKEPSFKETLEWITPFRVDIAAFMTPLYWPYSIFFLSICLLNVVFPLYKIEFKHLYVPELIITGISFMLSLSSRRFIPLFVFASIPMCLEAVSALIGQKLQEGKITRLIFHIIVCICIVCLASYIYVQNIFLSTLSNGFFNFMTADYSFPRDACEFIKKNHIQGKLFNYYNWGGYIIWNLYPDMPVFIDGRCHQVYSASFYDEYKYIGVTVGWQEIMDKYNVDIALLSKYNQNSLAQAILQSDKWSLFYVDNNSVIFLRKNEKNRPYMEQLKRGKLYIPLDARPFMHF